MELDPSLPDQGGLVFASPGDHGNGAGRRGHSSGGSAAGRKVSLSVRRRHQTRCSEVRSFDCVAALRRARCLKGPESLTGRRGKDDWRGGGGSVTRQADVDCPTAHSHMERVNSVTCRT